MPLEQALDFDALARRFWPGPLTLIVPRAPHVPDEVTAGLDTVALRAPSHPVARALLRAARVPIAAPSANQFSRPSPTTADHVLQDLEGRIAANAEDWEAHRLLGEFARDAVDLEQDPPWLDLADPEFGRALAGTHAHFGRLLRHRNVGKDADPDTARALHVARERAARGFDLARGQTPAPHCLQAEFAEADLVSLLRKAGITTLVLLSEFGSFWLQHIRLTSLTSLTMAKSF